MALKQGDIYYADTGDGGRRPLLIVSEEELNRGNYIVAVPFTSTRFKERSELPTCVPFLAGECGLSKDCVAQAEAITQIRIEELDLSNGVIGRVASDKMRIVVIAIGRVIDSDCEPS